MPATTNPARRFRVLGTTDTATGCDCCGRVNLKVYVALEPADGGPVVFYGTGCAAKAEHLPAAEIRAEARTADTARREAEHAARRAASALRDAAWGAYLDAAAGPGDRLEQIARLGGFAAASAGFEYAAA